MFSRNLIDRPAFYNSQVGFLLQKNSGRSNKMTEINLTTNLKKFKINSDHPQELLTLINRILATDVFSKPPEKRLSHEQ